ncbi:MAG: hypothetical protein ACKVW3_10000 [Phycisphaerales bacterium]
MSTSASETLPPECPRCGYDQAGIVASWAEACPLVGQCSECGLDFAWRDLLNPALSRQVKMFEHARRGLVAAFLLTWWKAARPWSFWRWVRMEHEARLIRAGVLAVLGALLTYVLMICATTVPSALFVLLLPLNSNSAARLDDAFHRAVWPITFVDTWSLESLVRMSPAAVVLALLATVFLPLTFFLLGDTLRAARVRKTHIARVWFVSLLWLPAVLSIPYICYVISAAFGAAFDPNWIGWMGGSQHLDWWFARYGGWLVFAAIVLWQVGWWQIACKRYIRLPHAFLIALLMTVLALLLAAVTLWAYPGVAWFARDLNV